MPDQYPPDYTTDVGRVRKYIPDIALMDNPEDTDAPPSYMWGDNDIQSFINDQEIFDALGVDPATQPVILRAAADILVATASNENLVLKKIVTEDLQTDGPSVAKALLMSADKLYGRAADIDTTNEESIFLIVDYVHTPPRYDWR